jgi:adenine nucleotide transporter 17
MIAKIYNEDGIKGFFKGIIPSLILTLNPVIQFTSYEMLKRSLMDDECRITNKNLLLISFISKLITIFSNYPLITIKTLYQANSKLRNSQVWLLILKLYKEEGILGFYKGLGPKILGSILNNTILMFTYERTQNIVRIFLMRLIFGKREMISNI